jgi:hypothetical protein
MQRKITTMAIPYGGTSYEAAGAAPAGLKSSRRISHETKMLAGGILILVGAFVYPYLEGIAGTIMPGCLFHRITGLPCLLCGMTRSLAATAHGHLGEAFRMHLLGPPFFLVVAVVSAMLAAELVLSQRILPRPGQGAWKWLGWSTLALLSVAWVARLIIFGINV